jgi:hypothetical protein
MKDKQQYNSFSLEQHSTPKVRSKKITEENVLRSDGSIAKHLVVDAGEERDVSFIKLFATFDDAGGDEHGPMDAMKELSSAASKIWLSIILTMDHKNIFCASMDDIMSDTRLSRGTVVKGIREIIEKKLLRKIPKMQSVYMINPRIASRVSPKYRTALETAWETGNIRKIESDMRAIDAKKREVTRQNAEKCRMAGLRKNITIPDLDDARTEDEEYEILHRKSLEEIVEASISRGEVI